MPFIYRHRRLLAMLLAICALTLPLGGCMRLVPEQSERPFEIYTSFYPLYALTEFAVRDLQNVNVHCLVQPQDGCLRSYALSDWDLYLLGSAPDLIVIGGRGLESFESQLYALGANGPAILTAFSDLTLIGQGKTADGEDVSHWETENPHLYLSVAGAKAALAQIADGLSRLMPEASAQLAENLASAERGFDALFADMQATAPDIAGRKVFLLNEALYYTAQDFALEVAGYYPRESGQALTDSEFERCLEQLRASEAKAVLVEKQAPQSLIDSLQAAGYRVARIDILSEGREDLGAEGYFAAQRANALALRQAFASSEN